MLDVYLALGSNLGNIRNNIEKAYAELEKQIGTIVAKSAFYYTQPQGFCSKNIFCNTACKIRTPLTPKTLLKTTQDIEKHLGRTAKSVNCNYSDRIIDIDILLIGNHIINSNELTIPHPQMHLRDFVLQPLNDIASDICHPILKKSIHQLLADINAGCTLPNHLNRN